MKNINRVCCVVLCVIMILSFASCKKGQTTNTEKPFEPTDGIALWNKIDETMKQLVSYETDGTGKMVYFYLGNKYEMTSSSKIVEDAKEGDPYSYMYDKVVVACPELSLDETTEYTKAYRDGKMYLSNVTGQNEQKFFSAMTFEEFLATDDDSLTKDINYTDCTKSEFAKNEDGTWSLKLSGYTMKTINVMIDNMNMSELDMGADILDMEITVVADSKFRATKMDIKLIFEIGEDPAIVPEFLFSSNYSKFDEVQRDPAQLNTEGFVEVDDVRVLRKVADGIEKIQNAASGKFTLDLKQTVKILGESSTTIEKDTVTYGKQNGGYYYNATAKVGSVKYEISYKSGTQTVKQGSETYTEAMTDKEAKLYVDDLINAAYYNETLISSIEKVEEGVYKFTVDNPDTSVIESQLSGVATVKSATEEIIVTLSGDSVTRIESKIKINGRYISGGFNEALTMTISATVVPEQVAESTVVA
ncbi:MAG: hypothetical protein E7525_02400 [Ruminococcaceae bacterium]|nr:hypothetical protein [Oscillospiraceae bacterium]